MNQDTTIHLQQIFHQVFEDPSIMLDREMTAEDVPMWDSLTNMTLVAEIESAFCFTFSFDEIDGMKNVGDMIDLIKTKAK